MQRSGGYEALELGREAVDALGRQVEPEEFDGNQTLAIGVVRTKDGTQSAGANLMENPERAEGIERRRIRSVRVQ
jgi:hypothetical protein